MIDHATVKLGRQPTRHDRRTLFLGDYLTGKPIPPTPKKRIWSAAASKQPFGMMLNDKLGDCTIAALGHAIQTWSANNGGEVTVPDAAILKAYEEACGYTPTNPSTDQGGCVLDVLKYARKVGIGGHVIGAFAALDPTNHAHLEAAMNLFGGVYIGVELPRSAQGQAVWAPPWYGPRYNGAPGGWGGHAIWTPDYSVGDKRLWCVTWGGLQPMTFAFVDDYVGGTSGGEAYAILSPDWVAPGKVAPSGLDLAALQADLAVVTG